MARNRTPLAKAAVAGSNVIHPGRFKDRKAPKKPRPVGEPYVTMTDGQVAIWRDCCADMPWLAASDRIVLRQVCVLAARMDDVEQEMGVSAHQALGSLLSKLGATPADVSKVNHGEDDEDEDDEFFGSGRPN